MLVAQLLCKWYSVYSFYAPECYASLVNSFSKCFKISLLNWCCLSSWRVVSFCFLLLRCILEVECLPVKESYNVGTTVGQYVFEGCNLFREADGGPLLLLKNINQDKRIFNTKLNRFHLTVLSNSRFKHHYENHCNRWSFFHFRSLVDTVYALKDEVQELRQVSNLLHI